jgi:hypothetical protein
MTKNRKEHIIQIPQKEETNFIITGRKIRERARSEKEPYWFR